MEIEGKRGLKEKTKRSETAEDDAEEEEGYGSFEDDKKKKPMLSSAKKGSSGSGGSPPCCQAERCTVDLAEAKRYHRRHKVCEPHSKAPVVTVAGLRQRFCQQCSRFHELSEFDEAKRSCRRRLAGHNERRRKNSSESNGEGTSHRGVGPHLKENQCRQADQSGRTPMTATENASYKHFQIR
ncbi:hypothetical protein Scep_011369 [Stephania cephalantha]|uniref:SBP-type domain-containing protein n=1 Tax=Stephania cephalantha TaxID=152367 RepID=A0AAP0JCY4_9MAGN